ncbi:short-chain dehydrogenase [Leptospira tipperaryensis]|uniref:Short-chain dehydrogenase n=1 Tax=Leptospira tipperaryensis TaxID=2564040 RepID=A0A1D7V423_9LEPT|nr:SDR family oxidoreductase [Leptospira tipperaryensis]AOP36543.1 short-chain dehydrogenase [Leptospira tipperaryensis]
MKQAVITGGTEGIGKATVAGLASKGWAITMVVRNPDKARNVIEEIQSKTGNKNIDFVLCDLSSLSQVAKVGKELAKKLPKIDALINNAGLISPVRKTSIDGYESNFAVNHLAHVLLTNTLLDNLISADQGRIIAVSSRLYKSANPNVDDFQKEKSYSWMTAYSDSKLFNIFFVQDLAEKLKGTKVTANALHPGVVSTELAREVKGPIGFIYSGIQKLFFLSPEKGAETSIYLADSPEVAQVSGQYFDSKKQQKLTGPALNFSLKSKLLEETSRILSKSY